MIRRNARSTKNFLVGYLKTMPKEYYNHKFIPWSSDDDSSQDDCAGSCSDGDHSQQPSPNVYTKEVKPTVERSKSYVKRRPSVHVTIA